MTTPAAPAYQGVAPYLADSKTHRQQIANAVNSILRGKVNITNTLTLTASAASTTLTDARIASTSLIVLVAQTAHASAEIAGGAIYIPASTQSNGSAVIQHANNSQTDRTFRVGIIG